MKFSVNVEAFARALYPAVKVATDKTAAAPGEITLQAKTDGILLKGCEFSTAIQSWISDNHFWNLQYCCKEQGTVNVKAIDFMRSLESFPSYEIVTIHSINDEVTLAIQEETQSLSTSESEVELPPIYKKYGKVIRVDREVFVRGIRKVQFAVGVAKTMPYYMVALFEAEAGKARFAAGSGAHFAILDVAGEHIATTTKKQQFFFPKDSLHNVLDILSKSSAKTITIKETQRSIGSKNVFYILIEFDDNKLFVLLSDPEIKYPNLDKVINYDYPCKIYSKVGDWRYALRGVDATHNYEIKSECDIHNVDVRAYFQEGYLLLDPRAKIKAKRKVNITHCDVSDPISHENTPQQFRCGSEYLLEIADKAGKDEEIVIAFESYKHGEKVRPALIIYPEKANRSKGIKEQFIIMFATSVMRKVETGNTI